MSNKARRIPTEEWRGWKAMPNEPRDTSADDNLDDDDCSKETSFVLRTMLVAEETVKTSFR